MADLTPRTFWKPHAAAPGTHDRVLEMLAQQVGRLWGLEVCDVPCGSGAFSARLSALGASVTGVDLVAVEPYRADAACRRLHDVNRGLPFGDAMFDVLVSIEGIEHLENPSQFLRECARVVRPNGTVVITTPNVDSFRSRKYVFFRGYHRFFGPEASDRKDSGHLLPIDMMFMTNAAPRAGLDVAATTVNRLHGRNWWKERLRPLLTRSLPPYMRGEVPFYGDVMIYALRRRS